MIYELRDSATTGDQEANAAAAAAAAEEEADDDDNHDDGTNAKAFRKQRRGTILGGKSGGALASSSPTRISSRRRSTRPSINRIGSDVNPQGSGNTQRRRSSAPPPRERKRKRTDADNLPETVKWEAMPDATYMRWKAYLWSHLAAAARAKMPPRPTPPVKSITESEGAFLDRKHSYERALARYPDDCRVRMK